MGQVCIDRKVVRVSAELHAMSQSGDEDIWQICERHLSLGERDIILDSTSGKCAAIGIEDGIGGTSVPVSWLANAPWIDQVSALHQVERLAVAQLVDFCAGVAFPHDRIHGDMGMPNEARVRVEESKVICGDGNARNVLPNRRSGTPMS